LAEAKEAFSALSRVLDRGDDVAEHVADLRAKYSQDDYDDDSHQAKDQSILCQSLSFFISQGFLDYHETSLHD